MLLHITFFTPTGDLRTFSIYANEFEQQLEVLNTFVANGFPVKSARLASSEGEVTRLPIEAFDGTSIREQLSTLEKTYKLILDS
ncbi:hypothetical protein [Larkinella arboricola]|uniref:Uncharacterized protein n=1 Tax=Larkinella arboricola TaxID=643671 RepID=A0A327X1K7_LARAB|nr:hypothetical protein [Larkinella arboricola]RAK00306.1 hypothetical protein LX87_02008 [Larkinella arboricola]